MDNTYLSDLIKTGSDAMSNMWEFEFSNNSLGVYHARVTGVNIPIQDRKVIELQYMNTKGYIKTPFVDLDKKFSFNIRVDENYVVYKILYNLLNAVGYDLTNPTETSFTATLTMRNPKGAKGYEFTFKGCKVVSLGKNVQYSYDSSKPLVIPVTIIYESRGETAYRADTNTKDYTDKATDEANRARADYQSRS